MKTTTSGGGYFFAPFSHFREVGFFSSVPGANPNYGNWAHSVAPTLGKSRFISIVAYAIGANTVYGMQVGAGPVGNEVQIFPEVGGIHMNFSVAAAWAMPFILTFPHAIRQDSELSVRSVVTLGPAPNLLVYIYLYD
jgi:hypothetical protein